MLLPFEAQEVIDLVAEPRKRSLVALPMPLTVPSPEAALEFLELLAGSVMSSGRGRRRRAPNTSWERRSDQGFLTFYRLEDPTGSPTIRPLKSPQSILRYLREQVDAPQAEHWVGLQTTQYRAPRDGKVVNIGYTADQSRHVMGIVLDLDGDRMDPLYRDLLMNNWPAFKEAVEAHAEAVGIDLHLMVRSSPEGVHLYVPLVRPDGRPLRARGKTLDDWERAAKGLCRWFAPFGADSNAVRATQPFALPGIPRRKHGGFIPYVISHRPGNQTNLYELIRRLSALKMMPRTQRVHVLPDDRPDHDVVAILAEIRDQAAGVVKGAPSRNATAHRIAGYLFSRGAPASEVWEALQAWNQRNTPPLSELELRRCFLSAERGVDATDPDWQDMMRAPWNGLRTELGLPSAKAQGYRRDGRWRPLTAPKPWEVRKASPGGREHYEEVAERLLRLVAGEGEGGRLELPQAEICSQIDTNRSTLRAVLGLLEASGRLRVTTKRGRNGTTVLELPATTEEMGTESTENDHSGKQRSCREGGVGGVRLSGVSCGPALPSVLDVLAGVLRDLLGMSVDPYRAPMPVVAVLDAASGGWLVVPRALSGRGLVQQLEAAGGVVELNRRWAAVGGGSFLGGLARPPSRR